LTIYESYNVLPVYFCLFQKEQLSNQKTVAGALVMQVSM